MVETCKLWVFSVPVILPYIQLSDHKLEIQVALISQRQRQRLTGSAVITHETRGTGYCLVGSNWITDFFNKPIRHSVT